MKFLLFLLLVIFGTVNAQDAVVLKSGRKVEGEVVINGNEVLLKNKYGTVSYVASEVTVLKAGATKGDITESKDRSDSLTIKTEQMKPVACQVTTRSGRKIVGNVFQKGEDLYFVELDGIVKMDPFVFTKKEDLSSVKGDIISGEKCNVVLKSGRAFNGIVEEIDTAYFVTSAIGTVKVEKKELDHIERSGSVLNLKEEQDKLNGIVKAPAVVTAAQVLPEVEAADPKVEAPKAEGAPTEMSAEEMMMINKKADEALKASKEESKAPKEIKIIRE